MFLLRAGEGGSEVRAARADSEETAGTQEHAGGEVTPRQTAIERYFRLNRPLLFVFAERAGVPWQEREDVVQTAAMRMWKAAEKVDPNRLPQYTRTVIRNVWFARIDRVAEPLHDGIVSGENVENEAVSRVYWDSLVDGLPALYRIAIRRLLAGRSAHRNRVYRARRLLLTVDVET